MINQSTSSSEFSHFPVMLEEVIKICSPDKGGVYIEMADIGHFPMSENHEVFRVYLIEALKIIQERTNK